MPDTLVLGGASWNTMIYLRRFPEPVPATIADARSNVTAGSTGLGKALALLALGHSTTLHATIGDDLEGESIRRFCRERRLDVRFDIDPGGTSRHVNLMDAEGRRISIFLFNGSAAPRVDVERMAPLIAEAKTIFLNITQSSIPLLSLVEAATAEVWVDLHDYDGVRAYHQQFIEVADVIQLSDEALPDPRPLMQRLAQTARLVICTRGSRGALALDAEGRWHEVEAVPATLRDSNGAGDCFCVAAWSALQEGRPLPMALRYAAAAASLAVESDALVPETLSAAAIADRLST